MPVAGEGCLTANADYPAALCAATRFGHILELWTTLPGDAEHITCWQRHRHGRCLNSQQDYCKYQVLRHLSHIFHTAVRLGASQCCGLVFRKRQGGSAVTRRIQHTTPFVMARKGTRPGKGSLSLCICKGLSLHVRKPFLTYLHSEATQTYRKHIYFSNRNIITAPCN